MRSRESFSFFHQYFDTLTAADPWAMMPERVRDQFAGTREASRFRILLEGPTYLMPPLIGARGDERARAPIAGERGRGARATRTHGKREPGALELVASLTEMVQRSMNLLSLYWISIPGTLDVSAGAVAGPSAPPPVAGRGRWEALARSRGRARGTRDESGPSKPILDDDDGETSEDEEAASPQSESSEDGESDVGLDSEGGDNAEADSAASLDTGASDSGADGDSSESMPRKRTKRAS
ncbi:hypothetical protein CsSME_00040110 [Camellia sinensis var. sinensis]